jgi:Gram-negative bacterial TonB protein C-terminal
VRLVAVVAPSGSVKLTQPVGGNPVLLQSAAEAVMRWKYEPAPEETKEQIEISFAPE